MKKINNKRNNKISLIVIICCIFILFLSGYSIGKTISKNNIESTGEIAEPILILEKQQELQINNIENQGIYEFTIKNYKNDGKITDIRMQYEIELLLEKNNNIDIKIFKDNKEIQLKNNKTEKYYLNNKQKQEEHFRLEIKCNVGNNVAEIYDNIQIKVHSEEVNQVI